MSRVYPYFDFHCDTILEMYKTKASLNSSKYMVNINTLKKYIPCIQTFAIYNDGNLCTKDVLSVIEYLKNECKIYRGIISIATNTADIKRNLFKGEISAVLAIESLGNQKDFQECTVGIYHKNGVRIMGLCHNYDNILCGGIGSNKAGLTPLGKMALRQMQSLGIILDVSHMSDKSFWEASAEYSLPFAATHSNSRKICPNPRNLTDEQFVYLAKRGGICGINFYPPFVEDENADIMGVIKHIEHFLSLGGENNICLGTDFDGMPNTVLGLENAGCVYKLFDTLLSLNYNETLVNKIAVGNFHNFLQKFETLS